LYLYYTVHMFLDLLFPVKCYLCQKKGSYLCQGCLKKIPLLKTQRCPRCAKPSPGGITHPNCQNRFAKLSGLISFYSYGTIAGQLVCDYKYEFVKQLGDSLADLTVWGLKQTPKFLAYSREKDFIFLPVPLFPTKRLFRGFDQSVEILSLVAQKLNLNYNDRILIRSRWTKQQSKLEKDKRSENVKKAFRVREKSVVEDKNFVLFDDVYTTGSTLKAAASALKSSGAGQVWGMTICRSGVK